MGDLDKIKKERSILLTIDLVVAVPAILHEREADHGTTYPERFIRIQ